MKSFHRRALLLSSCFVLSLLLTVGTAIFNPTTAVATVASPLALTAHEFAQAQPTQAAQALYEAGKFAEAASAWEVQAEALAATGDRIDQASILSNLALAYQQLGDAERSDSAIAQSLTLLNALTPTTDTATVFGQVWNNQGNLLLARSQPTEALEAFQNATRYYAQTNQTNANQTNATLRSQLNQAQALQALGFYRRALITLNDLQPPLLERPNTALKATGLQMLGDLLRITGDLDAAQTALSAGLDTAQTLNNLEESNLNNAAALLLSLGHTAEARQDTEAALDYYQQATAASQGQSKLRAQLSQLSITSDPSATQSLLVEIQTGINALPTDRVTLNARLALVRQQLDHQQLDHQQLDHQQLSTPIKAEQIAQNLAIATQQAQALDAPRSESYALGYLGELYLQQQQPDQAKSAFEKALTLADTLQAPDLSYQWQWQLGQLERQRGNKAEAIRHYDNAVTNLQDLRGNLIAIAPDLRFNFREKVEPVYRDLVDLLLSEDNSEDDATEPNPTATDRQPQLLKARQAIESLQLAEVEDFFQEPCVALSQQIDQVIENTVSPTAVIYPIILPDRLEILLKLPQQPLQQFTTHISQTELEDLLTQLQRDLRLPFTLNAVQAESAQLYDWLIRPLESAMAGPLLRSITPRQTDGQTNGPTSHQDSQIDTLVFVLDGFLRSIPMAALYDGQHYLIENYSIALAPGLQLVDPKPLKRQQLNTLIAGLSESRHGFSALPAVKTEVDQVQQTTNSQVLFNETFTETNLADAINNTPYPLVHLATHGQFNADPTDTFLLAWDKPIPVNALNRLLRQGEQTRQGAIELLILSACETAAGDKRAALGLAGVAVQAGARSTLASLWSLDDETGALFSNYFYQALQNPELSKAQAVRDAQLQLLNNPQAPNNTHQHPRYWAPYILLGNWL